MTAPAAPTVTWCARCDALETAHEVRTDGTRGRRYGQVAGATSNVACTGFQPGRVETLVPASELRRRLDTVLALHEDDGAGRCTTCVELLPTYWPCPTVRAARGET